MVLDQLAVGGMAQVHLARETHGDQRLVALKQVLPHLAADEAFLTMFLDEARIAARLHHPNVVEIYDLGREGDVLFIAMEFVHGEDLRRIERRCAELNRPFPPELACRVVREACKGLDYAHKRVDGHGKALNIVHRDVSPQNVLVSFEGVVKVADFGVAKAADKAHITASGIIKGKHPYMSPEQAMGREALDHRTDVFALGIVLYEAITGERLFRRATDMQTLQAVAECSVVPPSKANPAVPPALDGIVMKALARDREERWPTAGELGNALEEFLSTKLEASAQHLGELVSDLFKDRLEREERENRFAALPLRPSSTELPQLDRAKTIEVGPKGPVPLPPGAVRPTEPATPLPRGEVPTREARSKRGPVVEAERFDERATIPLKEPTVPFGRASASGTQAYGRGLVATVPEASLQAPANEHATINIRPDAVQDRRNATLETLTGSGPLLRPKSPLPRILVLTLLAAALGGGGGWLAVTKLRAAAVTCDTPWPVVHGGGKLWIGVELPQGTAVELRTGSAKAAAGMAMVVETAGGRSRLMAENVEQLPEDLFACPANVGR